MCFCSLFVNFAHITKFSFVAAIINSIHLIQIELLHQQLQSMLVLLFQRLLLLLQHLPVPTVLPWCPTKPGTIVLLLVDIIYLIFSIQNDIFGLNTKFKLASKNHIQWKIFIKTYRFVQLLSFFVHYSQRFSTINNDHFFQLSW